MTKKNLLLLGVIVSISINLFLISGIAFRVMSSQSDVSGRPLPPNVGWLVRDLDEQRRSELEPILDSSYAQIGPIRREMLNAQREVNRLMTQQPFDSASLDAAFASLRAASMRYQEISHAQTNEILGMLTEEERAAVLEFIERRGPRDGRDGFRGRTRGSGFGGPRGPDGRDDQRRPASPRPDDNQ